MSRETNSLVSNATKTIASTGIFATLVLGGAILFHGNSVHAASGALDDQSISSLTALDQAVENVAARVTPAVVNVAVTSRGSDEEAQQQMPQLPPGFSQFFGPMMPQGGQRQQPKVEHGIGSGIIISPDGYIVTNNHVIEGATQIKVTLNDRRILTGKLIGADKLTDLAVIKVDAKNLPSIPWGDSTQLKPGQTVLAFGSPFGYFQFSVTRGIVSAVNRPNPYSDDARKPGGFIQTDAAINPGNSGGALVNAHGELIGINTFIISNSGSFAGAGFAIPAQVAKATTDQIIKTGAVHHGYLGVSLNDVTPDNAQFFNLSDATGAIAAQVTPDAPAARAGLKSGDVIRTLNGRTMVNGSALQLAVSQTIPGSKLTLGILRDGKPETLNVTVGEYKKDADEVAGNDASPEQKPGKLGLAVANLTPDVRQQLQLPEKVQGVAIENVRPESPAEDAGLAQGDVILEVNRKPTGSAQDFVSQVRSVPAGKDLLLLVWSRGNASYRLVHPSQNG
ncbi:serine protease Do [Granulicella rosea]|uniref:Serine protease Do n=1 Tax=Granulicella rosea TaxID=474952 RepID=A0A239EPB6_9BACT|nr:Do family serine endopeptidase [Granulicella rosea]SNS45873.1 serine protease Do [Granulicella rosea]